MVRLRDGKTARHAQVEVRVCASPIFVVGAPRSGTSMLQHALRAHSRVWGSEESDFLRPLLRSLEEAYELGCRRGERNWLVHEAVSREEFLAAIGLGINALYTSRSGERRWVEQTPEYTLFLPQLAETFPGAVFLLMIRDGREVVHSLRHFVHPETHDAACAIWVRFVRAGLDFAASGYGARLLTVRHDEVVRSPRAEMARIFRFIGERYDDACAQFIERGPINSSFSAPPPTDRPRWADWNNDEFAEFERLAGSLLLELGFEADRSWIEARARLSG